MSTSKITLKTDELLEKLGEPASITPTWVRTKNMYGSEKSLSQKRLFKLLDAWSNRDVDLVVDVLCNIYNIDKCTAEQWVDSMVLSV